MPDAQCQQWLCPDLRPYWLLGQLPDSECVVLRDRVTGEQHRFSIPEGYALRHFVGQYSLAQVQQRVAEEYAEIDAHFVARLLDQLLALGILSTEPAIASGPQLKSTVSWRANPAGYWILRNSENLNYQMQVSPADKAVIEQLGQREPQAICQQQGIAPDYLRALLQQLAAAGMLVGTEPAKPKRGKFNPLSLLFFKLPLFNPDAILSQLLPPLRGVWSRPALVGLGIFLTASLIVGWQQRPELLALGQTLIGSYGHSLFVPFVLLMAFVVSLHELGHALTLKHYGGVVPEVGFLFMLLIPAAYTNTTDSYSLPRRQRVLVIVAGVAVQFLLAALGFWLWQVTPPGIWLHRTSLLLMAAALFTVAINLNPLARFDGYYLTVALTGINNLRSRSFGFYRDLLQGQWYPGSNYERWVLACYAPFSLLYLWFVFGFIIWRVVTWVLTNAPFTALLLLLAWLFYYYIPQNHAPVSPQSNH
ncbi:MAG: M50 family metallopeptidase [Spirulinaceae cyanobacterium SM2_1_0]|nr:M50 family metallopeptidase [Spirulinaceae cyanobacterium SM2_1_0]